MDFKKGDKVIITKGTDIKANDIGGIVPMSTKEGNKQLFGKCDFETFPYYGEVLEGEIILISTEYNCYLIKNLKSDKHHVFCNDYNEMELKK